MVGSDTEQLVAELQSLVGESLRVVATYTEEGYDFAHLREDQAGRTHLADEIHQDLVLRDIGKGHLEDLFQAGDLRCSMHHFEETTAFHFTDEEYTGLFVSVDAGADVPLEALVETCCDHLESP